MFIIWLFASVLQDHNWPVGITGEQCPTIGQLEHTLYHLQTKPYSKWQQLNN